MEEDNISVYNLSLPTGFLFSEFWAELQYYYQLPLRRTLQRSVILLSIVDALVFFVSVFITEDPSFVGVTRKSIIDL